MSLGANRYWTSGSTSCTMVGPPTHASRQAGLSLSSRCRPGGRVEPPRSSREGRAESPPGAPFARCALSALGLPGMRYADPFRDAGRAETTDHDFLLTCSCGTEQRLDEMGLDEAGPITLYECKRCTKSVVG